MTERNYHNATHLLATPNVGDAQGAPLRCHVLGKRGESLEVLLCTSPTGLVLRVFVDPRRVTELPSGVEDLL